MSKEYPVRDPGTTVQAVTTDVQDNIPSPSEVFAPAIILELAVQTDEL